MENKRLKLIKSLRFRGQRASMRVNAIGNLAECSVKSLSVSLRTFRELSQLLSMNNVRRESSSDKDSTESTAETYLAACTNKLRRHVFMVPVRKERAVTQLIDYILRVWLIPPLNELEINGRRVKQATFPQG